MAIPKLDPRDEKPCYDPGVDKDLGKALADNRTAWASCAIHKANVVSSYNSVAVGFGPKK